MPELQAQLGRCVVVEELSLADVAADHLHAAVAGLLHDGTLARAIARCGGGQSGAQGVASKHVSIETDAA